MANEILKFSGAVGANTLTQIEYDTDGERPVGNQPGTIARSKLVNKAALQASAVVAGAGEFMAEKNIPDITDQLTPAEMKDALLIAVAHTQSQQLSAALDTGLNPNEYVVDITPAVPESGGSLLLGATFTFVANKTNIAASPTIILNGGLPIVLTSSGNQVIRVGEILAGQAVTVSSTGVNLEVMNQISFYSPITIPNNSAYYTSRGMLMQTGTLGVPATATNTSTDLVTLPQLFQSTTQYYVVATPRVNNSNYALTCNVEILTAGTFNIITRPTLAAEALNVTSEIDWIAIGDLAAS